MTYAPLMAEMTPDVKLNEDGSVDLVLRIVLTKEAVARLHEKVGGADLIDRVVFEADYAIENALIKLRKGHATQTD